MSSYVDNSFVIWRDVKNIYRPILIPGSEIKSIYFNEFLTAITADTNTLKCITTGIAIGARDYNRIGRKITVKAIRIALELFCDNATARVSYWRFVLFYCRNPNPSSTGPKFSDLFQQTYTNQITEYNFWNAQNFEIIADFYWVTDDDRHGTLIDKTFLLDHDIIFNSNLNTGWNQHASGGFGLVWIAPAFTGQENTANCNYTIFWEDK